MGLGLRQPKSVHKTAIYGSFVGLKKVSIKLPYMAVLSTQKCVHRTALYGSSMDTLQNCHIWQLCPSEQIIAVAQNTNNPAKIFSDKNFLTLSSVLPGILSYSSKSSQTALRALCLPSEANFWWYQVQIQNQYRWSEETKLHIKIWNWDESNLAYLLVFGYLLSSYHSLSFASI